MAHVVEVNELYYSVREHECQVQVCILRLSLTFRLFGADSQSGTMMRAIIALAVRTWRVSSASNRRFCMRCVWARAMPVFVPFG